MGGTESRMADPPQRRGMGGTESRMADPPWRSKGNRFSRLAWLSGYAERIDQGCSGVLLAVATFVMNKLKGPHHEAIGFAISIIQGFRFTQALFKKRITVKGKRLNMIHDFAHYVNGGGIMAMTYGILILFFPVHVQYQIFQLVGLLEVFSIIKFPEILLLMKRSPIFRFTPLVVMVSMVIQLVLGNKLLTKDLMPLIYMVVGSCSLATLLCHEEITKRINVFFHIVLCVVCVIWNLYSLAPVVGYGVVLLFGTFFTGNIQFPAVIAVIALSSFALSEKDQKLTLGTICYIFTMLEGIIYLIVCWLEQLSYTCLKFTLARELNICYKDGLKALDAYYDNAYRICSKDKASFEDLSLTNYAIECLDSKQADVRLQGLTLLEAFVVGQKDDEVVSQISSSSKALTTIFSFLGSCNVRAPIHAASQGTRCAPRC